MAVRGTKSGRALGAKASSAEGGGNRKPQSGDGQRGPRKEVGARKKKPAAASQAKKRSSPKPARPNRQRMSRATRFQQTQGWEIVDVVDGIAIYDDGFRSVHYLNHSAAVIFLLCKTPASMEMLCTVIREEFKLKTEPVKEIKAILDQMIKTGLVSATGPSSSRKHRAKTTTSP